MTSAITNNVRVSSGKTYPWIGSSGKGEFIAKLKLMVKELFMFILANDL